MLTLKAEKAAYAFGDVCIPLPPALCSVMAGGGRVAKENEQNRKQRLLQASHSCSDSS